MKNKHVGLLIIGITLIFFLVVVSFNSALQSIVNTTCTHGAACPMHVTLRTQEFISYSLMGIVFIVGLFIALFMKDDQKRPSEISDKERKKKLKKLDREEKKIMNVVMASEGSVYQSDIIKETEFSKVKVTRILDKLEGRGLIDRKRRGMTNIIIQK
ncbi:helix-turn-helix transcriptional regulator [Nanoarchaeota archaeon]